MFECFATTSRGLETLLAQEIIDLGGSSTHTVNGGVSFNATFNMVCNINLKSRLASRVLIKLKQERYETEEDIYAIAKSIAWDEWFSHDMTIKVSTSAIKCPLRSLEFISLKTKDAICDYYMDTYQNRPDVDKHNPDIRILNFLNEDEYTIYIDTSGETLFKRGYRENKLEAPLKENIASALVLLSQWKREEALFDPMCGSGTIVIEALMMALNIAPGLYRKFAFEKFNNFYQRDFDSLRHQAKLDIDKSFKPKIYANDIDSRAVKQALHNLSTMKLGEYIEFMNEDFLNVPAVTNSGVMITNPPYGIRLEELAALDELYPQIAKHLKNNYANWRCYILTADLRMPKLMRLKPSKKTPLFNGSLDCRLFEFIMVSGSNR